MTSPSVLKLRHIFDMSREEERLLDGIAARKVELPKGADFVVQGESDEAAYVMLAGWALRHRQLADGRRQILNFLLPGDWAGLTTILFSTADHSVTAVTPIVVAPVSHADMTGLFRDHSRLALAIYWTAAQEEAVVAEHLVDVGRRNAYERLGHLFFETVLRLEAVSQAGDDGTFDFPLNQMALADALGLSHVHVNRTLKRLRREGLVEIEGRKARVLDRNKLEQAVHFESTYLHLGGEPAWLRRRFARSARPGNQG